MSKKREKKIKRLRKQSIWPQIIEAFIVEAAIGFIALMFLAVEVVASNQDLVGVAPKTCARIVSYVEEGWDSSKNKLNPQTEEQINNILKYDSESIGGVSVIDDNKTILASYGTEIEDKDKFLDLFSKKEFYENGVYYHPYYLGAEYEDELLEYQTSSTKDENKNKDEDDTDPSVSIRYELANSMSSSNTFYLNDGMDSIKNYLRLIFLDDSLVDKDIFPWATVPIGTNTIWIMYKTGNDGVNVAIQKKIGRPQLVSDRSWFILLIIIITFIFISIYENYKLIVAIANKRKIQKIIYTDPVTGGNNKDYFLFKAAKYIKRRRRRNVIVYLRMEKYRNYITAYGIKEGENLMEDFYKLLISLTRKRKELVAHLEKSDFVLLLHFDNEELLNIRMQTITQALNDCRPNQHLYFSVGACRIITKVDNIEEKISNAATAISKYTNPTNSVFWFDESMREEQVWERRVEDDMEKALANKEFQVYLQPKYSTKKEQLSAAEALVRWIHPECGFISPGRFIPIFEKNGFIIKLDDFMLTEISKLQAKWLREGKNLVPISVNVSRAHFSRPDLAEHICSIVDGFKVPHDYIELELTESAFFDDKKTLLGTVKKLKDFGFKVSMDDFGAGYSSLNSLKELPLDIIKLDAQFFREIDDKKRADLIVSDTIKLAKKLGMQIVAEGIETREQVDFLADQHCDLIQGFYFAKPLPIKEFEEKAFGV